MDDQMDGEFLDDLSLDGILMPEMSEEEKKRLEEADKEQEKELEARRERLLDIYVEGGCTHALCEAGYLLFAQPGDERNFAICGAPAVVSFEQECSIYGGIPENYTIPGAVLLKNEAMKNGGWEKVFKVQAHLCATHLFRFMKAKYGPPEELKGDRHCCIVPKNKNGHYITRGWYHPLPERCCLEPPVAALHNQNLCFFHLANLLSEFPNIEVEKLEGGAI